MKLVRALITAVALGAGAITYADMSSPQAQAEVCIHCWQHVGR